MNRRPNPPGWKQPKAPYNPYDTADQRPAEGYPSEYKTPGRPRNWSLLPKEPENYKEVKDTLRKLNYTPRPFSELYPGQFKVLKRKGDGGFNTGVRVTAKIATLTIFIGSVFFYRWNDGYDNVFSTPYKMQLRLRQKLFGNLSEEQLDDLKGKQRGMVKKTRDLSSDVSQAGLAGDDVALERPERTHIMMAEQRRQEQEEAILRAVDIAERQLASQPLAKRWWSPGR